MNIIEIPCKYDPKKVYLIKVLSNGHFYINQAVNGKIFYKRWARTTKKHVLEYLITPNA